MAAELDVARALAFDFDVSAPQGWIAWMIHGMCGSPDPEADEWGQEDVFSSEKKALVGRLAQVAILFANDR